MRTRMSPETIKEIDILFFEHTTSLSAKIKEHDEEFIKDAIRREMGRVDKLWTNFREAYPTYK